MILNHCNRIIIKTQDINENIFDEDNDTQEIISFNLFQIGELAKKLSKEFVEKYNKVPWKQIMGLRDIIVHGYDTINFQIIWNTAKESVPELKEYIEQIIKSD